MPVGMSVTLAPEGLERIHNFVSQFPGVLSRATRKTAVYGKQIIIRDTPRKTGQARRSWGIERVNENTWKIIANKNAAEKYVPYLNFGTGIYGPKGIPITPKVKKYLVFPVIKGNTVKGWVTAKSVKGIRAYNMIGKNTADILAFLRLSVAAEVAAIWKSKNEKKVEANV